jgi:hypothetical protein
VRWVVARRWIPGNECKVVRAGRGALHGCTQNGFVSSFAQSANLKTDTREWKGGAGWARRGPQRYVVDCKGCDEYTAMKAARNEQGSVRV